MKTKFQTDLDEIIQIWYDRYLIGDIDAREAIRGACADYKESWTVPQYDKELRLAEEEINRLRQQIPHPQPILLEPSKPQKGEFYYIYEKD